MRPHKPNNKYKNKRTFVRDETPRVPSYIIDKFKAIAGVTEVKTVSVTRDRINLTVVVNQKYNQAMYSAIINQQYQVAAILKSRRQDIEASIGWQ